MDNEENKIEEGNDTDDEEYYEDPIEIIKDFGQHPLMERAQKALTAQLKEQHEKLKIESNLKEEELKRLTLERENLGVQLYSLQQQLAKLQIALESAHNEFNGLLDTKIQEEELVKNITRNNMEQKALLDEHRKQEKKYASELEALNDTLRQIQSYNDEVKSEIAMTRRATHKAEQSMQHLEKHKEFQDVYVDNLTKQVVALQEQIALHTGQIDAQRNETKEANGVLQDTIRELEMIAHEKKQLVTQWKAALAGLSRRDEALSQASQTLANAERAVHDYDVEIVALKRNIQKEQGRNEDLCNVKDRIENELQWVEENLNKIRQEKEQLQERFGLLTKSLSQTDGEAKKLAAVAKSLGADSESLLQNLQIVTRERQRIEDEVQIMRSTHSNVNKAVVNLQKQTAKIVSTIHEKELEAIDKENEIARSKVDSLNAKIINDQLQDQLNQLTKEFSEKESLIDKYQVEIRQRNDEIEKKMYRVDRLNKKYDKMVESSGGEENLGPLENTCKNLEKEIEAISNECKELERDWLKKQTEMVGITSESDKIIEENHELQARVTILSQQQLRMTKDLRGLKGEITGATQSNGDLQKDVAKLNALISQNQIQETALQNDNYVLEMGCIEELKRMERDSLSLQASINELKSAKAKIMDEIIDTERQALLWEKKIQLDKETKAALDPSIGQQESQNMEREIHRMELRLEALKREQERLSIEMERAVNKRTAIATRFKAPTSDLDVKKTKSVSMTKSIPAELTQATAKKRLVALKKESKLLVNEVTQYTGAIEERKVQFAEMTAELDRVTNYYSTLEETNRKLQSEINDSLYQKQLNHERISYKQKFIKKMSELSNEGNGIDGSKSLQIERRLLDATQGLDNVKEIIIELQTSNPHLTEVLDRVLAMCDPVIQN
jgi:chromosome segregation ATPase